MRPQPAPILPAPQPQPPPQQVKDAVELFRPPGRCFPVRSATLRYQVQLPLLYASLCSCELVQEMAWTRLKRPKKIALVLRGLPGSGKSYAASRMREIEVEEGGSAPRIHSIDDYFVTVSKSIW